MLIIVDDYSGFITAHLMVNNSESMQKLKDYVVQSNNKHGVKLKAINSDNGGEFTSVQYLNYCRAQGLQCGQQQRTHTRAQWRS